MAQFRLVRFMWLLDHLSRNRWVYIRLVPLAFALLWPSPAADAHLASFPILPAVGFIIVMAFALFFWIILGPDEGGRYSLAELLVSAPFLPISRSTAAIWAYLGVLILVMTLAAVLWSGPLPLEALLLDVGFGGAILCATALAHSRLTRRCS